MNRVFHQRFTLIAKCSIALFSLLAAYFFWIKSALIGTTILMVVVGIIERVVHSSYTFVATDQGEVLTINRGRFSKNIVIRVDDIIKCTRMTTVFGIHSYLLLEYGVRHFVSIQPDSDDRFMEELKKRLEINLHR